MKPKPGQLGLPEVAPGMVVPERPLRLLVREFPTSWVERRGGYRVQDYVYFIQAANTRHIKIGRSWDPWRRLGHFQIAHVERLLLLGYVDGGIDLEKHLHRMLAEARLRGEWFRETPRVAAVVRELVDRGEYQRYANAAKVVGAGYVTRQMFQAPTHQAPIGEEAARRRPECVVCEPGPAPEPSPIFYRDTLADCKAALKASAEARAKRRAK